MSLSNATETAALDAFLRGADPAYRAGATSYLALFTADPTETGSLAAEANYTGYARVALTKASSWTGSFAVTGMLTPYAIGSMSGSTVDNSTLTTAAILAAMNASPPAVNIKKVNDVTVTGTGEPGTEWGPV